MKLQRTSLFLVLAALAGGGTVYLAEQQKAPPAPDASQSQTLFTVKEADLQEISVKTATQTLLLQRAADSTWKLQDAKGKPGPAHPPTVAYLANLLATGKRERVLKVGADRKPEFGLDTPLATIEFKAKDGQPHRLLLGKPTYNRSALYAQVDPDPKATDLAVSLISPDFENAVNRPIGEWQPPKPKPSPKPDPTAEPAVDPTAEPTAESSPSPTPTASPTASPSPAAASPVASPAASPSPAASVGKPSPSPAKPSPSPKP